MMKPRIWKTLVVIAAVLICDGVAAQHTVDDLTSFIVVLRPLPRGQAPFDPKTFGGTLEHRSAFRMVVLMPEEAVANMRSHPGVRSVQRVGTGMPRRQQSSMAVPKVGVHGDGLWSTGAYAYDGKGRIVSIGPNSDAKTDVYGYDSLDRLKTASVHAGTTPHSQSYEYDQYGNLTARTTDGVRITTPANPSTNRLAASLGAQYDASGNMTHDPAGRDLQYDAAGMVTASEGRFVYLYTADDERVVIINRHLNPAQWRWTLRDLSQKVVREYTSAATGTPQQTFLWLEDRYYAGSRLIAADMEPSEGGRRHFHLDHLGSTRLITNGSGERISSHTYYPFGAEATSIHQAHARGYSREEPIRFTGHERDDLGSSLTEDPRYLDYMHARFYGPAWGRFLSVDPKNRRVPLRQPQLYNRYAYAMNNPLNFVDLDGEDITPIRVLMTGGKPKVAYIDSRMVPRLQNLVAAAHKQGVAFTFGSMLRTQDQQDAIKTGNTKNNKGTSPHTAGLAIDINVTTSLKGTDLAGLTTIARGADLSPLNNQASDLPHFQANDLITRGKDGKVDDQFKALVEENQQQLQDYEKLRKECPEAFAKDVVDITPPRP